MVNQVGAAIIDSMMRVRGKPPQDGLVIFSDAVQGTDSTPVFDGTSMGKKRTTDVDTSTCGSYSR